jgi:hypothetical protein
MGSNAGQFDGQTAWQLAPATGRTSETIDCSLTMKFWNSFSDSKRTQAFLEPIIPLRTERHSKALGEKRPNPGSFWIA